MKKKCGHSFTWSYGFILEGGVYECHEIYWNDDEPTSWTEDPVELHGETKADVKLGYKLMGKDIRRGNFFKVVGKKLVKV